MYKKLKTELNLEENITKKNKSNVNIHKLTFVVDYKQYKKPHLGLFRSFAVPYTV